jgi:predicted component of type VI protein secretion system
MERESALLKQLEDTEERTSSTIMKQKNDELETILKQKNDEFEQRISAITVEKDELQLEIQRIRKDSDGTNLVITGLEEQLSNCNKEIDKQRRKHRSEMNKLMNTLELQQKKEGRLQSHIQSLERQIEDMVNDYESRLQDAFYSQM